MIRILKACPVVCIVIALVGVLPTCFGSDEEVSKASSNSTVLLEATGGENGSEDEIISYRQPRSANPVDYAKREAAYKNLLRTQSSKTVPEDPEVLCGENSIHVRIRSGDAKNLRVYAPNGLPLTLKELPVYCNIIPKTLDSHVVLVSRFDGCFVQPQDSAYVLNLMWFGRPIQVTCPREKPPLIICKTHSMQVLFFGEDLEKKLSVNVNGRCIPLQYAPALCQFELYSSPQMLSFSTTYTGCGMTNKNGFHNLSFRSEVTDMTLSCPANGFADPLSKTPKIPEQPSKTSQSPQPPQVQRVPQQVPQQVPEQNQGQQASQQNQVQQASQQNQVQQRLQEETDVTRHQALEAAQSLRPAIQQFLNRRPVPESVQQFYWEAMQESLQQVPQQTQVQQASQQNQGQQASQQNQVQQASQQNQVQQEPQQSQVPQPATQEVSQASNQVFEPLDSPPSDPSNSLELLFRKDPWSRVGY